jgi:CRP-like cAMP-binding protein
MPSAPGAQEYRIAGRTALFRGVEPARLPALLGDATVRICSAETMLFVQGDDADAFFIVLDGWVKLFRSTLLGEEAVIGVLTSGQTFGEAVALVGARFPVSAQAVTATRLLRVPAASLRRKMQAEPGIAIAMLASTLQHLHLLVDQIEQLKAQTGAQRVAEFLLSLAPAAGHGPATVELPYDKSLLAGRLGMKPESLSRAFGRLRAHGVSVDHARVTIADPSRLRDLAMTSPHAPERATHQG